MYTWHIAHPEEFIQVCDLFKNSGLWNGEFHEIQRRVSAPLLIKHLITFYNEENEFCGFATFAFLDDEAENHIPTTGVLAADWRSGDNFWAIDFIVKPGENGYRMMRGITKQLRLKKVRHFRDKYKIVREMRA